MYNVVPASTFESEEAALLTAAYRLAFAKLEADYLGDEQIQAKLSKLVLNIGMSCLRHRLAVEGDNKAAEIAEEALGRLLQLRAS